MKKISSIFAVIVLLLVSLLVYILVDQELSDMKKEMNSYHFSVENTEQMANDEVLLEQDLEEASFNEDVEVLTENEPLLMTNATFTTNKGTFEIELFTELAPNTVANFLKLTESGFYDQVKFHRVIKGFMIQSGDPLSKDDEMEDRWGTGGPGYQFEDEIHGENNNVVGTISMANAGPDTNGSQFFINTADNSFLDTKHTVFGKVVSGMETVKVIEGTETFPNDRPVEPIVIESIKIN